MLAIGQRVIDLQPAGAKDFVVALFGTNDKLALEIIILVVALAIAAGLGVLALRRPGVAPAAFVAFAARGVPCLARRSAGVQPSPRSSAGVAGIAGSQVLGRLIGRLRPAIAGGEAAPGTMPDWSRRAFLIRGGALAAGAVVAGAPVGRSSSASARQRRLSRAASRDRSSWRPLPPGAELAVDGLTPARRAQ